ncbi:MAG: cation:proton antiporter [Candidatus Woesearchaeota archaeon]|jgi:CPA2 family monovalent cation:H+ antiporter-2|nr:cation:proton antiporter [Candidatus Woesearchaeota archaeon]
MVGIDPILPLLVEITLIILIMGFLLKLLKLPYVIGYILAGLIIGPYGLKVVTDVEIISLLGSMGVVILLFFVGMEISLKDIIDSWKYALVGTLIQVGGSVLIMYGVGHFFSWPINRIILLGFIISLSSTAVVLKILGDLKEKNSKISKHVISILLFQDIIIVPMIIILGFLGGTEVSYKEIMLQIIGGILIIGFLAYLIKVGKINLKFLKYIKDDKEMEIFASFILCFGFALITGLFGLSVALGAFIAGIVISVSKETKWVKESLEPFYVVFVAIFFISIGMLLNLDFIKTNYKTIMIIVFIAFFINTLINYIVLRALGNTKIESMYGGVLLSQIGEFSFVLAALGISAGIISDFSYDMTISIISLTLLLSPFYILIFSKLRKKFHIKNSKKTLKNSN